MKLEDLKKRLKEINDEIAEILDTLNNEGENNDGENKSADLDELDRRSTALIIEKRNLEMQINILERKADAENAALYGIPVANINTDNRAMDPTETVEYRNAFYNFISGKDLTEQQRSTLITVADDGIAIPKSLDTKIWDCIHTDHPITRDVDTQHTGIVLEVTKHTGITAGKATTVGEGIAPELENNTFAKVTLAGKDFSKVVELSYAAAKMTQGALENYLAEEIAAEMSEALAKYIFGKIKTDLGAAKVTVAKDAKLTFTNLATAIGSVKRGSNLKIYCSRATKFQQIVGMVDTAGQPVFRDGVSLGCDVIKDAAAGDDIYIIDPTRFILNVVQPMIIETDKDIKAHKHIYSGYLRAEGCMRDSGAGAYVTFATA